MMQCNLLLLSLFLVASPLFANEEAPIEVTPVSRMDATTKDPKRDPGIFGEYWWANRFLSRHQLVEANRDKTVDLVMLGDSIVHFWEWRHPESWQRFVGRRNVLNLGYGGDRTQAVLWRIEHGELDGYVARKIVLMIGTNNNTSDSTRPENVAKGVEKIISLIRAKQPHAELVLHPIFPRGASADSVKHANARRRNDRTNVLLKEFAEKDGKINWIDFNRQLLDESGWVPKTLMADEIHPTDAGYEIWMNALKDAE